MYRLHYQPHTCSDHLTGTVCGYNYILTTYSTDHITNHFFWCNLFTITNKENKVEVRNNLLDGEIYDQGPKSWLDMSLFQ